MLCCAVSLSGVCYAVDCRLSSSDGADNDSATLVSVICEVLYPNHRDILTLILYPMDAVSLALHPKADLPSVVIIGGSSKSAIADPALRLADPIVG